MCAGMEYYTTVESAIRPAVLTTNPQETQPVNEMSDEMIALEQIVPMSMLEYYAGVESAVRPAVEAAIAESRPLPEWKQHTSQELKTDSIQLTAKMAVEAFAYSDLWYARAGIRLARPGNGPRPATRLAMLRETLAAVDEARPVLASLIEAAIAASEQDEIEYPF